MQQEIKKIVERMQDLGIRKIETEYPGSFPENREFIGIDIEKNCFFIRSNKLLEYSLENTEIDELDISIIESKLHWISKMRRKR